MLSSHQVMPPQPTQPIPDPILHDYEHQHREQELFGQLVSMARSNRSNIWQQPQNDPPWLPQIAEKPSSMLLPPTFGESSASTSTQHELEATAFTVPQPRQQTPAWHRKDEREYRLEIIQQPSRARMCGFGDKDRRPISPPPILQLLVRARDGTPIPPQTLIRDIDTSFFVVLCDCFDETGTKPANMLLHSVPLSTSQQQQQQQQHSVASSSTESPSLSSSSGTAKQAVRMKNLVGSCIASPSKLYNEQRELGIFFVFHDLSLRSEGRFRLTFSLIDIGSPNSQTVNTKSISHVLTTATSSVFTAYTAKNFPGVVPPTTLSQCFAKQGVKIPTRRDTKSKRKKISEAKEDEGAAL
ncbi:velvet factor-domain-containing protein [Fennellomyces sp. T-0311]|nr:velvet factor-domain-containing protein [Fennellomyces sp. T-0311]